jgi:hypothetical protein
MRYMRPAPKIRNYIYAAFGRCLKARPKATPHYELKIRGTVLILRSILSRAIMLNPNIKILNPKQIPIFQIQNSKQKKTTLISKAQLIVLDFNDLDFEFVWDLDIGICFLIRILAIKCVI